MKQKVLGLLSACSRCVSSLFPGFSMGHRQTLANTDADARQNLLSHRNHYACSGRYIVSSQRKKNQRSRLLAGCCSFEWEKHCLQSGSSYFADTVTMGRRTSWPAHQYEIASQKTADSDRTCDRDDKPCSAMAAGKTVSSGCRWFLRMSGWKAIARYSYCFQNKKECESLRTSAKAKKKNTGQTSQERQTACQAGKDGRIYSGLAADRVLSARQNDKETCLCSPDNLVQGYTQPHTSGNKQRPIRQGKRRFSFYNGFGDDSCRSFGMLQRPLGYRRYFQKYQTASWRSATANLQRRGAGKSSGFEFVSVFYGLAVVSATKVQNEIFPDSAMVQTEIGSELCGCVELPPARACESLH